MDMAVSVGTNVNDGVETRERVLVGVKVSVLSGTIVGVISELSDCLCLQLDNKALSKRI